VRERERKREGEIARKRVRERECERESARERRRIKSECVWCVCERENLMYTLGMQQIVVSVGELIRREYILF